MAEQSCLSEQDLMLLYYGEVPDARDTADARQHVADCAECGSRYQALKSCLDGLPAPEVTLDPHHATRMAARVNDRLSRHRPSFPALASIITAAIAVFAVTTWTPQNRVAEVADNHGDGQPVVEQPEARLNPGEAAPDASPRADADSAPVPPDVDLLENLDLLRELDTLSEIVGV